MKRLSSLGILLAVVHMALLSGCAKKGDESRDESHGEVEANAQTSSEARDGVPQESNERQQDTQSVVVNDALESWRSGQQREATRRFLSMRWDDPMVFEQIPVLTMSDQQFKSLSGNERTQVLEQAMELTAELRKLMFYVVSSGETLASQGDKEAARECFEAVRSYGRALSQSEHLEIIRGHGTAAMQYAEKKMSSME